AFSLSHRLPRPKSVSEAKIDLVVIANSISRVGKCSLDVSQCHGVGGRQQLKAVQPGQQAPWRKALPQSPDLAFSPALCAPAGDHRPVDLLNHFDEKDPGARGRVENLNKWRAGRDVERQAQLRMAA